MLFLVRARGLEPSGERHAAPLTTRGFSPTYWRYLAFAALAVMGFAHFALIAFRFAADNVVAPATIPLLIALAMGVDAGAAYLVAFSILIELASLALLARVLRAAPRAGA